MERSEMPVDEFIGSLDDDARHDIAVLDGMLAAAFAGEPRVLWEGKFWGGSDQRIIGYGEYSYENASGNDVEWFKVGLARQKAHISLYVNAVDDGEYVGKAYADRLGSAKVGAASISFKSIDSIDLQALEDMIEHARSVMS
ncbi:MAG: DUF1801 domain-containing protein [Actinobacteria bacterium]|nr:MAG: DUF1801 domain-containing protein [Actinomycetota bacterium]